VAMDFVSWANVPDQIPRTQDVANTTDRLERLSASVLFGLGWLVAPLQLAASEWVKVILWFLCFLGVFNSWSLAQDGDLGSSLGRSKFHVASYVDNLEHLRNGNTWIIDNIVTGACMLHAVDSEGVDMLPTIQCGLDGESSVLSRSLAIVGPSGDAESKDGSDESTQNQSNTPSKSDEKFQLFISEAIYKCLHMFVLGLLIGPFIGLAFAMWWYRPRFSSCPNNSDQKQFCSVRQ